MDKQTFTFLLKSNGIEGFRERKYFKFDFGKFIFLPRSHEGVFPGKNKTQFHTFRETSARREKK